MNRRQRRLGAPLLLLLGACATRPVDPYAAAERSLLRHDLAGALQALDAVPVAHARYPEARAAAVDVERDMRRCHELMLEAMLMRSEWRDLEALSALQKVRVIWPGMPGVEVLIEATEQRRKLFDEVARSPSPPRPVPPAAGPPAAPIQESKPIARVEPVAPMAAEPASAAPPEVAESTPRTPAIAPADDPVALGLVAVETRLGHGQLEAAVADLLELARRFPSEPRVRLRLVRLLHQRALLRYGDGAVAMAIADWQRVLEIDPNHHAARRLLEAAEREGR